MADQREDLYRVNHPAIRMPPSTGMDVLRIQRADLEARGIRPTGISLSMDFLMDATICAYITQTGTYEQKIMGLPLTIIGDANGVIAWSFNL